MKLLFVHDHKFILSGNEVYSEGKFSYNTWLRFLKFFDELTVMGRSVLGKQVDNDLNKVSGAKVSFEFQNDLYSFNAVFDFNKKIKNKIHKIVKAHDAVVVRLPSRLSYLVSIAAIELNKPLAVEVAGCTWGALTTHGSLLGKIYAPISYCKMKRIISKSDFAIYVTQYFLQKRYPCLGESSFASNVETITGFGKLKIQEQLSKMKIYNIGLIGSYTSKYKGISTAIRSLKLLLEEGFQVKLHILGSGNSRVFFNNFDTVTMSNVKFHTPLRGGDEVLTWLDQMDLYIQPSLTEGLPRALIEAMSRGLPCIGSNVGGIPELLSSDYLIVPKDYNSLFKKIKIFIENNDVYLKASNENITQSRSYMLDHLNAQRDLFWLNFYKFCTEK